MNYKPLLGKNALVFGVANKWSIAWAVAKTWHEAGANLIVGYQGERLKKPVEALLSELPPSPPSFAFPCDVSNEQEIKSFFSQAVKHFPKIDLLLHSIAFAPKEALEKNFYETTREDFLKTFEISVYSFIALAREAKTLFRDGGSILTLSYYGSEKVISNYKIMGPAKSALESSVRYLAYEFGKDQIRVNAVSPGPINTLAARGISGFTKFLKECETKSPLKRNVEAKEVASVALFLASDESRAITGQTIYVDCGYSILGF
ncbi:enoyl-ACP reductase [Methylacidiphilum kamchatkense Kam1]|uniref:Enoyl-[acyl-carrier-protein] reductase [NADH] n=1 Tax=Methylacidiphilum kamchatkense Kam1 TaxID=1202785 RepID=A0A0C1RUK4_9BACT|nr:enoyl-ACP reductase [Methylacidiphilum kamchatkense]KIE58651.1 enoyl-ACP reductase [Methylacidiphilum kamchatkense Kam1]QDQ41963.1 enoyl-[acyl-carrier-protein] reductase [NADH] [Methylacidiphilum kamchatkense Kam1]